MPTHQQRIQSIRERLAAAPIQTGAPVPGAQRTAARSYKAPIKSAPVVTGKTLNKPVYPPNPSGKAHGGLKQAPVSSTGRYGGYTIDQLYNGIAHAETGSFENPWVRTTSRPPGGSTAYGPVQLTHGTVKDFVTRYPSLRKTHNQYWNTVFDPQGQRFKRYGNEPHREGYDARYDYHRRPDKTLANQLRNQLVDTTDPAVQKALTDKLRALYSRGTGMHRTAEDRSAYERMAKDIMRTMAGEIKEPDNKQFLNAFLKRWRGATPTEDYSNKVRRILKGR